MRGSRNRTPRSLLGYAPKGDDLNRRPLREITDSEIATFESDGVVCLRQVLDWDWIERMRGAVDRIMASPSDRGTDLNKDGSPGRFFQDVYMWTYDRDFRRCALESPIGEIAATCMRSSRTNILADMLLCKEPHTPREAPWHHDQPYNWANGWQVCGIWIGFDSTDRESGAVEWIRGSHRWGRWFEAEAFDPTLSFETGEFEKLPDIESSRGDYNIVHFDTEPGDIIVNHLLCLHHSPGNFSDRRRRALTYRFAGADATFAIRKAAPPLIHDPGLDPGDAFPPDHPLFPQAWPHTQLSATSVEA